MGILTALKHALKRPVSDCQMCGQCLLHDTGMTCPMTCPKTLRHGPCGGVRENGHCEVTSEMRCNWVKTARGSEVMLSKDEYGINWIGHYDDRPRPKQYQQDPEHKHRYTLRRQHTSTHSRRSPYEAAPTRASGTPSSTRPHQTTNLPHIVGIRMRRSECTITLLVPLGAAFILPAADRKL